MEPRTSSMLLLQDLMKSYGNDVWNLAYSFVRNPDAADDITQDVFVKVYQKLDQYRGESSVRTWLLRITRNTAIDYKRSYFFRKVTLLDTFQKERPSPSAENEAMANIARDEIWETALRLPVKYREVLVLYAHHHLSIKEISELLGLLENTVRSRLLRARNKVSKQLGGDYHA